MKQGTYIGAGVISAIAASLCCIIPVIALIAGSSGIASAISWFEPVRPYFIAITLLVLGFAWFQKLKPVNDESTDCDCEPQKNSFLQSRSFLSLVTVFALLMLAFPYYSQILYPPVKKQVLIIDNNTMQTAELKITGMDCEACTKGIEASLAEIKGVYSAKVEYSDGKAFINYDTRLVKPEVFIERIKQNGYTAILTN